MESYGKELILDLFDCDPLRFTRMSIENFFIALCDKINMERCELFWWDDLETPEDEKETEPHLVGTSAVQFIKTSNITIHTLDILKVVYLNIFSCKDFDEHIIINLSSKWFQGKVSKYSVLRRE